MDELLAWVQRRLGLQGAEVRTDVVTIGGLRVDAAFVLDGQVWLVETKRTVTDVAPLAHLALLRETWPRSDHAAHRVLVTTGIASSVRQVADAVGVQIVEVPFELFEGRGRPGGRAEESARSPLTTPRSWRIVCELLVQGGAGTISDLAVRCGVSIGWAHQVVRSLAERGLIRRARGSIRLDDAGRLLDQVGLERPLRGLEVARIETGLERAEDALHVVQTQLTSLRHPPVPWAQTGRSAAAWLTGREFRSDVADLLARPEDVAPLFDAASGGAILVLHRPDRDLDRSTVRGIETAAASLALLDVAGLGLPERDLALALLEVMRR